MRMYKHLMNEFDHSSHVSYSNTLFLLHLDFARHELQMYRGHSDPIVPS